MRRHLIDDALIDARAVFAAWVGHVGTASSDTMVSDSITIISGDIGRHCMHNRNTQRLGWYSTFIDSSFVKVLSVSVNVA